MKNNRNGRFYRKKGLVVASLLALLFGLLAFGELTDRTFLLHDREATSGVIPTMEPKPSDNENGDADNGNADPAKQLDNPKQGSSAAPNPSGGSAPVAPSGNFVSNHSPNLDGKPAPSSVQSICNTTPGATCYLEFRKGSIVKTLPTKAVGNSGSVSWDWDVNEAGFTEGNWEIKAVASLNNKTSEAKDSLPLKVGP